MIATLQEYAAGALIAFLYLVLPFAAFAIGFPIFQRIPYRLSNSRAGTVLGTMAWLALTGALYILLAPSIVILRDYSCRAAADPIDCRTDDSGSGD